MPNNDALLHRVLWRIRMAHTVIWAVFVSAIVAIPIAAVAGRIHVGLWLSLFVWAEVIILAANRLHCPLTGLAARYTMDRSDNFDIFLPLVLAKHNKLIFGCLFVAGEFALLWRWTLSVT